MLSKLAVLLRSRNRSFRYTSEIGFFVEKRKLCGASNQTSSEYQL